MTNQVIFLTGSPDFLKGDGDRRFCVVEPPSSRPKSAVASRLVREARMVRFLHTAGFQVASQEAVAAAICSICEVETLTEFDRDPAAAARFDALIAAPYEAYKRSQQ